MQEKYKCYVRHPVFRFPGFSTKKEIIQKHSCPNSLFTRIRMIL